MKGDLTPEQNYYKCLCVAVLPRRGPALSSLVASQFCEFCVLPADDTPLA